MRLIIFLSTLVYVTTTVDMSKLISGVYMYEVWVGVKRLSGGKVFKIFNEE